MDVPADIDSKLFRAALQHSYEMLGLSSEDGTVLYSNPRVAERFRVPLEQLIGSITQDWVHPEDRPLFQATFDQVLATGSGTFKPYRVPLDNGEVLWLEATASLLEGETNPRIIIINARDITEQKETVLALQRSQESLLRAQEFAHLGHLERDAITDKAEWSDETFRILGYEPQAFEPTVELYWTHIHPDDYGKAQRHAKGLYENGTPFEVEHRLIQAGGGIRWVRARGRAIRDEQGKITRLAYTILDITERKATEDAHAYFAAIFQSTQDAIIGTTMEGSITYWNEGATQLLGYSQKQMLGQPYTRIVPESDHADYEATMYGPLAERNSLLIEKALQHQDGTVFDVSIRALMVRNSDEEVLGRAVIIRDISDQKKAQQALAELLNQLKQYQLRLDAILDNVPGIVWECEIVPETNALLSTFLSQYFETLLGYDVDTWLNRLDICQQLSHPDDVESARQQHLDLIQKEQDGVLSYRMITQDGQTLWTENHCVIIRDTQGVVVGLRGVTLDVTDRIVAQQALREAYTDLEQRIEQRTEQLAEAKDLAERANHAKSDFLSRMSHELRTPLNAILGFGQILKLRQPPLTESQQGGVNHILQAGQHLLSLIDEVLDIGRVETGAMEFSFEPVRLQETINESLTLVQPLADQRHIRLQVESSSLHQRSVYADRQRLRQVVINLLSNAIKYNVPGGEVLLSCQEIGPDRLRIQVRDTGLGIKPEDMEKLFKPFERLQSTRRDVEGTGLGLALSKYMVEAMRGSIGVQSEWRKGSTFFIDLQEIQERAGLPLNQDFQSDAPITDSPDATSCDFVVLSIEDNVANSHLIQAIMEVRPRVKLLQAFQGRQGLELALTHQPDLIFLDLQLPDIQGDEILDKIQQSEATSHIPVVVISADATEQRIHKLLAAGARDYITKPLNVAHYLRTLDSILGTLETK